MPSETTDAAIIDPSAIGSCSRSRFISRFVTDTAVGDVLNIRLGPVLCAVPFGE